ncbi:tRNA-(guanine-N1)-methyltransferase [Rhizobium sp. Leaf384]|uniref:nitrite reductase small subunit NirD n=1 Tax=unclassified Rhizobium TaxID=2613769 RepID=UPI000713C2CE|nr:MULTISPECIES: nitrite reductase small subunit NirD [unclassified Rhizobium]KQS81593.1 tRNA-(guanine-N1)-methyltransferase [Rhizobium sp. Leaf384]KQS87358.1 tRNA-(guanine-N1)-methyltransferase [Rhizobium sp. Leaf383]
MGRRDAECVQGGFDRDWVDIGVLHDIPLRGARCVRTPLGRIAVFRTADDQVFAIEDRCPHKAGPLSQGIVHGTSVTCPLHNMVISLETGQAQGADEGEVRTIPIRNRDGRLSIAVDTLGLLVAAE